MIFNPNSSQIRLREYGLRRGIRIADQVWFLEE